MASIQAITSTRQHDTLNHIIEEIKQISCDLTTINFAITHVFSHINIRYNEQADLLTKTGAKLANKQHKNEELTISTAKKVNKEHSIDIWSTRWSRQSHAKYKNIVPEINRASLKQRKMLLKVTPASLARKMFRLKTGHNLLPANMHKIDKTIDPLCQTCKVKFDENHLFFN